MTRGTNKLTESSQHWWVFLSISDSINLAALRDTWTDAYKFLKQFKSGSFVDCVWRNRFAGEKFRYSTVIKCWRLTYMDWKRRAASVWWEMTCCFFIANVCITWSCLNGRWIISAQFAEVISVNREKTGEKVLGEGKFIWEISGKSVKTFQFRFHEKQETESGVSNMQIVLILFWKPE